MSPNDSRLDALQRYAEGTASRDDVAAIERAIAGDAEFRTLLVEYLHLDAALEEFGFVREAAVPHIRSPRRWYSALAAAVAVAVMGFSWWLWRPGQTPASPVEVEVLQLVDVEVAGSNRGLRAHDLLQLGSLEIRGGEARLRLPSAVELTVSGPAELRFIDAMHARVTRGKVTVDCSAAGQGFVIDTPVTRVVDISTQFGVEARADGSTDVMVIKGSVELLNPQKTRHAAPLTQGEAVRVDTTRALARIVNITGGPRPGQWSTQPPPPDCNIISVSDNFGASEGYHFYRIVPHGLEPGAVVYTNRAYVWKPLPGQPFPASLTHADVVQTFFGELTHPAYAIEIQVARPVDLFVLMPRRGTPQPWLTESFTRTGDQILLDEGGVPSRPRPPLYFEVWKRTILQAGKVTLGPGNRDDKGGPTGMYGIAAKAL